MTPSSFIFLALFCLLGTVFSLHQESSIGSFIPQKTAPISSYYRDDPYEIYNFTQRVNILDPLNFDVYPQRYYFDRSSFQGPSKPLFVYFGAEAPLEYYWFSSGGTFRAFANKAGAAKLFIEHREYGTSLIGTNSYLSTEHALEDAIRVILHVVKNLLPEYQGKLPQIIAGGGSYAGMLAAYARTRYPHIISAAVASSAPFNMIGQEWKAQPLNYAYFKHVTDDYFRYDPKCVDAVRLGFDSIDKLYYAGNFTTIQTTLNVCEPVDNDQAYGHLIGWIRSAFIDMAQGNNPNNDANFSYPAKHACDMMLSTSPIQGLAKVMDYAFKHELKSSHGKFWTQNLHQIRNYIETNRQNGLNGMLTAPLDFSKILAPPNAQCHKMYEEYVECVDTSGCGGDHTWDYQACTQLVYFPSCDHSCMFPSMFHGLEEHAAYCKKVFGTDVYQDYNRVGISFPSTDWKSTSNILFTQGYFDPWCDGGVLDTQSDSLLTMMTIGGSHHYDLNTPTMRDDPSVGAFRELEYEILMEMAKVGGPDVNKLKQFRKEIELRYPVHCYPKK